MTLHLRVDNREHDLVRYLGDLDIEPVVVPLEVGDIEFEWNQNKIILERKSLSDLKASIRDGRYREQKGRLRTATASAGYIIEGGFAIGQEDSSVVGAVLNTLLRDRMMVLFSANTRETALYIREIWKRIQMEPGKYFEGAAGGGGNSNDWIHTVKTKVKRIENIDPATSTLMMLSQIPGVSAKLAQSIYAACCAAEAREAGETTVGMAQVIQCLSGKSGAELLKSVPLVGPKKASVIRNYLGLCD